MDDKADGIPTPARFWAVSSLLLVIVLATLDASMVNVALPALARQFGASAANSIWIVNGYQIAAVAALLPTAAMGERWGYSRVFVIAVVAFTLSAMVSATAHGLPQLVVGRVMQGVSAAGLMSVFPALMRFTYPRAQLGRALALNSVCVAVSAAAGPAVGSAILTVADWPWLFAPSIPVGVFALLASRALPRTAPQPRPIDPVSVVLNAGFFGLVVIGLDTVSAGEAWGAGLLGAGVLSGGLLLRRDWSRPTPLVPLELLRDKMFATALLASVFVFTAQMLTLVCLPFHLSAGGLSQLEIGARLTVWPAAIVVVSPLSSRLAERFGATVICVAGAVLLCASQLLLSLTPVAGLPFMVFLALGGAGYAMFTPTNTHAILTSAPRSRSGAAGGLQATARVAGQTLGAAMVAMIFSAFSVAAAPGALALGGALALVAAGVSVWRNRLAAGLAQQG